MADAPLGHKAIIPPRIGAIENPVDDEILDALANAASADISDIVGPLYTMAPGIKPLYSPIRKICGRALTVKAWPGDNLAIHGALAKFVKPGDVLVVDWRGHVDSCGSGGRALTYPFEQGLRGVVIDGAWRDVDELKEFDFPVYARATSPFSPSKLHPGEINVPIHCGGVIIHPGDVIVADDEGISVAPRNFAAKVAEAYKAPKRPPAQSKAEDAERAGLRAEMYRNVFDSQAGLDERQR